MPILQSELCDHTCLAVGLAELMYVQSWRRYWRPNVRNAIFCLWWCLIDTERMRWKSCASCQGWRSYDRIWHSRGAVDGATQLNCLTAKQTVVATAIRIVVRWRMSRCWGKRSEERKLAEHRELEYMKRFLDTLNRVANLLWYKKHGRQAEPA